MEVSEIDFSKIADPAMVAFPSIGKFDWGYVSVAEAQKQPLPFEVKRVFWTYYTPNEITRGQHSHYALHQMLIAVAGTIRIELENLKGPQPDAVLDHPSKGLHLPPMCWTKIHFSHNAVLMSLCSMPYTESDYIRSYDEFLALRAAYRAQLS
jgi:hypothetical protein